MPNIDLSILNQRQTPAFYASSLATRPAFGFAGRIFIDTDSPSTGLYRDTGAAWVQIADPGAGTTGTLQQVTTNGNTTSQGITITAGGLSSNIVNIAANGLGSTTNYIGQTMATNDNWKIFGTGSTADVGEMVFQVGDNGSSYASGNGERFRFSYDVTGGTGSAKDVFIVDYDTSYFNTSLGVNTSTPTADFDVHSGVSVIAQLNQTVATNNSLLAFQNSGTGLWRIGNFYNAGANDWGIFDVVGAIQPVTVKKTTGQVLIGTSTVGSGKLVVASSTGDNGVQIVGATAPSLRIDNAESGPTKRAGLGISTATNNFIQGSADRDFCMFNGSTTASPILFGIYDAAAVNVQEAARISPARNFLVGTTTDAGQKLQVNGSSRISQSSANIVGIFEGDWDRNATNNNQIYVRGYSNTNKQLRIGFDTTGDYGYIQALISGTGTNAISLNPSGGNVGINVTSPTALLELSVATAAVNSTKGLRITNPAGTALMFECGSANDSFIGTTSTSDFDIRTNNTQRIKIGASSGNVLIGTTTDAGQKLQVAGRTNLSNNASAWNSFTTNQLRIADTVSGAAISISFTDNNNSNGWFGYQDSATAANRYFYWSANDGASQQMKLKSSGVLNLASIPTSSAGLVSGDIYSNLGVLTIVP